MLAGIPKLSSTSQFSTWRLAFETYALSTGCSGILNGSLIEPGLIDIIPILAAGQPEFDPRTLGPIDATTGTTDQTDEAHAAGLALAAASRENHENLVQNYQAAVAEHERRLLRAGTVPPVMFSGKTTPKEWEDWAKKEGHMQGALRGTVSAGLLVDIKDLHSAKAMWDLLHATHPIDTAENRAAIRRDLSTIVLDDTTPKGMERHLERFNSMILRSTEAGNPIAPATRAQMFADTLPRELEALRTIWGMTSKLLTEFTAWPTMLTLYNEEIDRRRRHVPTTSNALATTAGSKKKYNGKPKKEGGWKSKGKDSQKEGEKETRTCYNCNKQGHLAKDCRQLKKAKQGRSDKKDQKDSATNYDDQHHAMVITKLETSPKGKWMWDEEYFEKNTTACEYTPIQEVPNHNRLALEVSERVQDETEHTAKGWLVDSGATNHLTPTRALLSNIKRCEQPIDFGTAASKGSMKAREYGSATIELDNGQMATLFPVYLVPNARLNLLSVSSATSKGWGVNLNDQVGQLSKDDRQLTFARHGEHWYIPPYRMRHEALVAIGPTSGITRSKLEEEHRRLGHLGRPKLLELAEANLLQYPWKDLKDDNFRQSDCPTCQSWKAVRPPKNDTPKHPTQQGMLLHIDIAGPFDPSRRGNRWLVVIVDDFSNAVEVVPTKQKSEAFTVLRDTATRWSRQFGNDVRIVRSDGDSVFLSEEAKLWYREEGIRHQVTPRYTPELNGKAERYIRTIKDGIRSMLGGSCLGHAYWDYAAQYFVVIHNKTTVIPDTEETVWETLTMRHPNLHTVRQFGQVNYVQIPSSVRRKDTFDTQNALRCKILGQDPDVSGWIVLVEATNEIIRSRDVKQLTGTVDPIPDDVIDLTPSNDMTEHVEEEDEEPPMEEDDSDEMELELEEENTDNPPSEVSMEVVEPKPTRQIQITPITFERVEQPTKPGYDKATHRYIDKTGIIVNESLIDDLKQRHQMKEDLGEEARGLLKRWKHYQLTTKSRSISPEPEELGRGQRQRKAPTHHDDERWHGSNARNAFLASETALGVTTSSGDRDPTTYQQATSPSNIKLWQPAITKELDNLRAKKVFRPWKLPQGRKAITCRWIFTTKRDADGVITKRKARLVARGFSQQPGVDFEETFAPVSRLVSLRILLTLAATLNWDIHQADVEGAYLNGKIKEEIYMEVPPGYRVPEGNNCVRVDGALYGLKQAATCWWEEVGKVLRSLGFKRLQSEWGLYYRDGTQGPILILVYVDDFMLAARNRSTINKTLADLKRHWTITDTDNVTSILGMKVVRDKMHRKITVTQPGYIDTLLARFPLATSRQFTTPLPCTTDNLSSDAFALTPYQQIVGSLMWIAGSTRPDIAYAVNYLSRYSSQPTEGHWQQALRVVSYLGSTRESGLTLGGYGGDHIKLIGWVDADWGGCLDTRRSTTGYVFTLNGSMIAWSSRRQQTVASSTLHAEYIAMSEATREAIWLRTMLKEMNITQTEPTTLYCDNQGAMFLAKNPITHARTKHIDIRYHIIREMIESKTVSLIYTKTEDQLADIFTKALSGPRHGYLIEKMHMSRHKKKMDERITDKGLARKSRT